MGGESSAVKNTGRVVQTVSQIGPGVALGAGISAIFSGWSIGSILGDKGSQKVPSQYSFSEQGMTNIGPQANPGDTSTNVLPILWVIIIAVCMICCSTSMMMSMLPLFSGQ